MRSQSIVLSLAFPTLSTIVVNAFSPLNNIHIGSKTQRWILPSLQSTPSSATTVETTPSFIDTELRGAAMKLHTKSQAPKEGEAPEEQPKTKQEPYVPTHMDYLKFLIDSQYVYQTFESILESSTTASLQPFQNTGLERSIPLEKDITFMTKEYNLERPAVGEKGLMYGEMIKDIMKKGDEGIPEFMCHYYNYYFAHTAGGRMIGKQMAALLLDKKTLEFYKWEGDLNEIKSKVKNSIEEMAASWSREEKDQCIGATAAAFMGGGGINAYLSGGRGGHH